METLDIIKYAVGTKKEAVKDRSIIKSLWAADMCQFGSGMKRASLEYQYLPAEYSQNGNPLFLGWSMGFDGGEKARKESPDRSWTWNELKSFFPDTKFED